MQNLDTQSPCVRLSQSKFVRKTNGQLEVTCSWCGTKFYLYKSLAQHPRGNFCNRDCLGAYRSKFLIKNHAANYKTGSRKSRDYIEVEAHWHPSANKRGYIALHRLLVEAKLGRFLKDAEIVHHKNHDPRDNHWDNLDVMTQSEHARLHITRDEKTGRIIK